MIPMMKKNGYEADYAVGVTIASAIQGVVVPPSHNLVLYSLAAGGVSIASLFMAGIVPGVIMLIALCITGYIIARKRGYEKAAPVPKSQIGKYSFTWIIIPKSSSHYFRWDHEWSFYGNRVRGISLFIFFCSSIRCL